MKKHMERCSTSPITREMKIKTTVRHHLTPLRMTIIKKSTNKMVEGVWRKGNPLALLMGMYYKWHSHYGEQHGGFLKNCN